MKDFEFDIPENKKTPSRVPPRVGQNNLEMEEETPEFQEGEKEVEIGDVFADFNSNQQQPHNQQNQQNQQQYEQQDQQPYTQQSQQQDQYEQYDDRYESPRIQLNRNLLTVAGAVVLILVIYFGTKFGFSKFKQYRIDRENRIRMYNSGTNVNYDYNYDETSDNTELNQSINSTSGGKVISEIAKYSKIVNEDGRTSLNIDLDDYGKYSIFIPHIVYENLDEKGYIIVDLEIVSDKVTYVYISEKQDNLKQILGN